MELEEPTEISADLSDFATLQELAVIRTDRLNDTELFWIDKT